MNIYDILSKTDHTLLKAEATWDEVLSVIDDAAAFSAASVCIPPSFVSRAAKYSAGRIRICTVIGFPNGYETTKIKVNEATDAAADGADELDMVINIGMLKENRYEDILKEICSVRTVCPGKILKVIIETCLLTDKEKIEMCKVVSDSGADFIKTSTGFSYGGATLEDVKLLRDNVAEGILVKASGGIRTIDSARELILAGASRLGASALIAEAKKLLQP
jgi:deoxyribose-phosphate aldolase